ncbi:phage holin family protein [Actinocorallia sp. API 0066]|uniref:phage holin family protein n=1 Tax=Actinocorallia sp. API 0066 TaxID=2896846 RepID=UPI001E3761CF|nr:phage holin family protein [Actinocorallia sp. API 0066]MCD0452606.1 phage holin family protein [Actinocorallia sp. API 0066]
MKILINVVITALALAAATWFLDGITVTGSDTQDKALTLVLVALIFGVVNAVLKPIIKTLGCAFYVLTLGLFGLVVNAALLLLTSWIAEQVDLGFHVADFWPTAIFGGIIVAIVSWALSLVLDND